MQSKIARGITRQLSVTTVSQLVMPADLSRKSLLIINNHPTATVIVSFGASATLTLGMPLLPGGGGILFDNPDSVPTSDIHVIGTAVNYSVTFITT